MKSFEPSVRIPADQRFYLQSTDHLIAEIQRLGLTLPLAADNRALLRPLTLAGERVVLNRFCARTAAGNDAGADGAPSPVTCHRYERLALGGAGIICSEPIAVLPEARRHARQLCLHRGTRPAFSAMLASLREKCAIASVSAPVFVCQLDDTGTACATVAMTVAAAQHAAAAGFDGVELYCNEERLRTELIQGTVQSPGDALDKRALFICDVAHAVHDACPELAVAVRLCVYSAHHSSPGFGTDPGDYREPDAALPMRLARRLAACGVSLLNTTANYPALRKTTGVDADRPIPPDGFPHEHPLLALTRGVQIAGALRRAVPELRIAAGGLVWLRQFMPALAGGLIRDGVVDLIALDRFTLAYPSAPSDAFSPDGLLPLRCCNQCGACSWLREAGGRVGCVLQQSAVYGAEFRFRRRYSEQRLFSEARRCHQCMPAPCSAATPARLDIPAFMRAYAGGNVQRAGRLLRQRQCLPEMCAQLAPFSASGEQACIETVLSAQSIAIRDLQYSAAVQSRNRDDAAIPLTTATGRHIAIAGAGPTGLAAAAALLCYGHSVTLYERGRIPGGVPALLIPESRYGGPHDEIQALLGPARRAGRLRERYQTAVGTDVSVATARADADALLLAVGLWQDRYALGQAQGVHGGLAFLEQVKAGQLRMKAGRTALLAGGDCAMDAAIQIMTLSAEPLYILFAGGRSDMHWCMDESWFAQPGVHLLTLCKPVEYRRDNEGRVTGLRTVSMEPQTNGGVRPLSRSAVTIAVDTVVDASGLAAEDGMGALINGEKDGIFAAGALVNGGASVPQCVEEGTCAAQKIHRWLMGIKEGD